MIVADWERIAADLDALGCAVTPQLLATADAEALSCLYSDQAAFRSTVHMARHRFGEGEYRYFAYPLPVVIEELRHALYPNLVPIARRWHEKLGARRRGPTRWTSGWTCATRPARRSRRRSC